MAFFNQKLFLIGGFNFSNEFKDTLFEYSDLIIITMNNKNEHSFGLKTSWESALISRTDAAQCSFIQKEGVMFCLVGNIWDWCCCSKNY